MRTQPPTFREPPRSATGIHDVEIDGERVLYDTVTGRTARLDRVGSLIWSLLDGETPLGELVDDLAAGFSAPRDVVANDVLALLVDLWEQGFLVGDAGPEAAPAAAPGAVDEAADAAAGGPSDPWIPDPPDP
jgi:hypothetical protein